MTICVRWPPCTYAAAKRAWEEGRWVVGSRRAFFGDVTKLLVYFGAHDDWRKEAYKNPLHVRTAKRARESYWVVGSPRTFLLLAQATLVVLKF